MFNFWSTGFHLAFLVDHLNIFVTNFYLEAEFFGYKNSTTVTLVVLKRQQKGQRGLGSPSSVYSPKKRQGTEGEEKVMSP